MAPAGLVIAAPHYQGGRHAVPLHGGHRELGQRRDQQRCAPPPGEGVQGPGVVWLDVEGRGGLQLQGSGVGAGERHQPEGLRDGSEEQVQWEAQAVGPSAGGAHGPL